MQHLTIADATPAGSPRLSADAGFHLRHRSAARGSRHDPVVNFNDVPTLETTWRAAVFHVRAASTIHLEVVAGSGPTAPYSLTALGGSVTHVPPVDSAPYDEVRVWFAFTGQAAPGVAPDRQRPDPLRRDEPGVQRHARGEHRRAPDDRRRVLPRQVRQHGAAGRDRRHADAVAARGGITLRRADARRQWRGRRQLRSRCVSGPAARRVSGREHRTDERARQL